jgi:hypothetical protein
VRRVGLFNRKATPFSCVWGSRVDIQKPYNHLLSHKASDSINNAVNNNMYSIINKFQRSLAFHGYMGTFKLCVTKAFQFIFWFTPSHRRARTVAIDRDLEFDRKWGVDTSGFIVPDKSKVVGPNWINGSGYQGIDPAALEQVLRELPIDHEHFSFVDFGSGKGRAILVASSFPFRKILGVEYSEQLIDIARHNLSRFPKNARRCEEIDLVCADAATCLIPKGPLVIFLYNPFGKAIMEKLVQNVRRSFQQDPRRIVVVYFNPVFADTWRSADFMEEVQASGWLSIYDTQVRKASTSA